MKRWISIVLLLMTQAAFSQRVYHVAISGNDRNPGTSMRPLRTINAAAQRAKPGDNVIVHTGIYREWVQPEHAGTKMHPIVYEAAPQESVWIKGSEVVKGWIKQPDGKWQVQLPDHFFGHYNPYNDLIYGDWFFPAGKKFHTGQVYLNGKALKELIDWTSSHQNDLTTLTANFGTADPNKELAEINVRPACFYPVRTGVNYVTVKGFHMAQAATQWAAPTAEQVGIIGTNWSKGWIIEDNVISDSRCAGITLGKDRASGQNPWSADMNRDGAVIYNAMVKKVIAEGWAKAKIGSHLVRHNEIYSCGQAGICGSFGAIYSKIIDNDIHDIYTDRSYYGAEMAGIKLHAAVDVEISGNRIYNTFIGIWLDWMAQGTRVSRNLLYQNDYVDFFPEVDHGPYLVENNFLLSTHSIKDYSEGGAYIHNLIAGSVSCAPQGRVTPWFKPNTTILAGEDSIKGGDDRFYANVFVRGKTVTAPPKMHPWDEPDSDAAYGLACYRNTALIKTAGNVYIKNRSALLITNGQVYLKFIGWPTKILIGTSLGKTKLTGETFPAPDNKTSITGPLRYVRPGINKVLIWQGK